MAFSVSIFMKLGITLTIICSNLPYRNLSKSDERRRKYKRLIRLSDFHEIRYWGYLGKNLTSFGSVKSGSASHALYKGLNTSFCVYFPYFSADWDKIR